MKKIVMVFASVVLVAAIGCEDKKTPPADKDKGVDVKAGDVEVKVDDDKIKVGTPGADVDIEKNSPAKGD